MNHPIILIGPGKAGKTTVGKLLAEQTGLRYSHLWETAERYWNEAGFDHEAQGKAHREAGQEGVYRYMLPLDAYAIQRAVVEDPERILELGAVQAAYDDPEILARVEATLRPYRHVILLMPSPGVEESCRILQGRHSEGERIQGKSFQEYFVTHPLNFALAKHIVYTKGKSPEETCDEVLSRIDPAAGNIVLIGPMRTGKSTIGGLLAEKLQMPRVSVDSVRFDYYEEIGWSKEKEDELGKAQGFLGVYAYWKPFELYAVGRILSEHQNTVIDFGAGHSVYDEPEQQEQAKALLARFPNVVLLLPSPDPVESVEILNARQQPTIRGMQMDRFLVEHLSKTPLAKQTVYTEGKTPEEVTGEILHWYRNDPS